MQHTEERNAGRVRLVQRLSILKKVLGTTHELAHSLESCHGLLVHL